MRRLFVFFRNVSCVERNVNKSFSIRWGFCSKLQSARWCAFAQFLKAVMNSYNVARRLLAGPSFKQRGCTVIGRLLNGGGWKYTIRTIEPANSGQLLKEFTGDINSLSDDRFEGTVKRTSPVTFEVIIPGGTTDFVAASARRNIISAGVYVLLAIACGVATIYC